MNAKADSVQEAGPASWKEGTACGLPRRVARASRVLTSAARLNAEVRTKGGKVTSVGALLQRWFARKPTILLVTGPSGAGKTTIGHAIASTHGAVHVEGDKLWRKLGDELGVPQPWRQTGVKREEFYTEMYRRMAVLLKEHARRGDNVVVTGFWPGAHGPEAVLKDPVLEPLLRNVAVRVSKDEAVARRLNRGDKQEDIAFFETNWPDHYTKDYRLEGVPGVYYNNELRDENLWAKSTTSSSGGSPTGLSSPASPSTPVGSSTSSGELPTVSADGGTVEKDSGKPAPQEPQMTEKPQLGVTAHETNELGQLQRPPDATEPTRKPGEGEGTVAEKGG